MSDQEKAIVRACLEEVQFGMAEARSILTWWARLGDKQQTEFKVFAASVTFYLRELKGTD